MLFKLRQIWFKLFSTANVATFIIYHITYHNTRVQRITKMIFLTFNTLPRVKSPGFFCINLLFKSIANAHRRPASESSKIRHMLRTYFCAVDRDYRRSSVQIWKASLTQQSFSRLHINANKYLNYQELKLTPISRSRLVRRRTKGFTTKLGIHSHSYRKGVRSYMNGCLIYLVM